MRNLPEQQIDNIKDNEMINQDDFSEGDDMINQDDFSEGDDMINQDDFSEGDDMITQDDFSEGDEMVIRDDFSEGDDMITRGNFSESDFENMSSFEYYNRVIEFFLQSDLSDDILETVKLYLPIGIRTTFEGPCIRNCGFTCWITVSLDAETLNCVRRGMSSGGFEIEDSNICGCYNIPWIDMVHIVDSSVEQDLNLDLIVMYNMPRYNYHHWFSIDGKMKMVVQYRMF